MNNKYCRGCGTPLQTKSPDKPGFIPEELLGKSGNSLICKRCYRIIHYGESGTMQPGREEVRKSIIKAIELSNLMVLVVDFADLTGSLQVWKNFLIGKSYILVLNKIDLLPSRTKMLEITNYINEYLIGLAWNKPSDIILASSVKGNGVNILAKSLLKATAPGGKIALLGVTNVGKSSLIKQILALEGSVHSPTVSKFPGTTIGLSNWSILKGRNTLIDTPGLVSGDRMGDLLCLDCASQLLSATQIEQKLWGLKPGKGLIIGGLWAIQQLGDEEVVMLTFTSSQLNQHRTDNSKVDQLMTEKPDWLMKTCKKCQPNLSWQEETITLQPNYDLAVAGLGWVSLRGKGTTLKITLPTGVRWEVRPALIGKRD